MKTLALLAAATLMVAGCQSETVTTTTETDTPATEATAVAFNLDGAPTTQIHVPDMMCEIACPPAVKEVLTAQAGVKDVKIDFETKTATVAVDEASFDGEAAVAALVDYQFSNAKLLTTE